MRKYHIALIIVLIALISSCNSRNERKDNSTAVDKGLGIKKSTDQFRADSLKKVENISPETFLFKYSECISNCADNEKIIKKKFQSDSLILKLGTIQNCIGRFRSVIRLKSDTLLIDIKIKEKIRKHKNGRIDTILVEAECDCYYYFDIGIKNLKNSPRIILLDGHKIGSKIFKGFKEPEGVIEKNNSR